MRQLESIGAVLGEITAELDAPGLTPDRHQELMRQVDLLEEANITIGCRLLGGDEIGCGGQDPRIEDEAEWNRVYRQVMNDASEYLAPL